MNLDLAGKTALVCGASTGIGRAAAEELAALGANVVVLARSAGALKRVAAGLGGKGRHGFIAADVAKRDALKKKTAGALKQYGTIHILVNNAGGPPPGAAAELDEKELLRGFEQLVVAGVTLSKLLLPGMKKAGYGRIINITSTSTKIPIANLAISNTVRAATANWAKTLSTEVARYGITVNNVLPGYTGTERLQELVNATAKRRSLTAQQVVDGWLQSIPAGRFAAPDEVGAAVAFLATPAAGYINGVNLPVDGGRLGCL